MMETSCIPFSFIIVRKNNKVHFGVEQKNDGRQLSDPIRLTGSALSISEKLSDLSQYMSDGSNVNARCASVLFFTEFGFDDFTIPEPFEKVLPGKYEDAIFKSPWTFFL